MATNFPSSLDSLTNPTSSDSLASPSHSAQHANVNDAVEALQAKVGVDGSAVTSSLDYKLANLGTWTSFTPTWTSAGTQPTLGNGTLLGRYCLINDLLAVEVDLRIGSTSTVGTGSYYFSSPVTLAGPLASFGAMTGGGFVFDPPTSAAYTICVGFANISTDKVLLRMSNAISGGEVGATNPFIFTTSAIISFGYVAKAA